MTDAEYRRELLLTKIDAHRSIFRLELRTARRGFDPMGTALGWVGIDRAMIDAVASVARAILAGATAAELKPAAPAIALVVAALVAFFSFRHVRRR